MISCFDVAKYFLSLVDEDTGDLISNLKLQKLVYYAQGFHLAIFDEPLFPERIEAWTYGPVVPDLYHDYKEYGAKSIPAPTDLDLDKYDAQIKELLNDVFNVFGQFSAWKLQEITHEEPPWKKAKENDRPISNDDLKAYFETLIEDE